MNYSDKENRPLTRKHLDADQIYRQGNITGKKIRFESESCIIVCEKGNPLGSSHIERN